MDLVVLVALKFLVYCGVVAAAVPLLQLPVEDRRSFTLKWAGLRLAMGLAFGFVIAALYVAVGKSFNSEAVTYLVSFGLVRVVEWSLVLLLLHHIYGVKDKGRGAMYVLLGVAANTTFDMLALAAGVDNLKFVC